MTDEQVRAFLTVAAPAEQVFAVLADPATHAAIDGTGWVQDVVDRPRAMGWFTGTEDADGHLDFGGWCWRYDLEQRGPGRIRVTLTYDWSAVPPRIREYLHFPPFGPEHLADSLRHLAGLVRTS